MLRTGAREWVSRSLVECRLLLRTRARLRLPRPHERRLDRRLSPRRCPLSLERTSPMTGRRERRTSPGSGPSTGSCRSGPVGPRCAAGTCWRGLEVRCASREASVVEVEGQERRRRREHPGNSGRDERGGRGEVTLEGEWRELGPEAAGRAARELAEQVRTNRVRAERRKHAHRGSSERRVGQPPGGACARRIAEPELRHCARAGVRTLASRGCV